VALDPRDFFAAFTSAVNAGDREAAKALMHPDFTAEIPQSGERSHGFDQFWAQFEAYPGGAPRMPAVPEIHFIGEDDRWAISPAYTVVLLAAPNVFTMLGTTRYPDGRVWHVLMLVELRNERLFRLESFFAPELPAPLAESIATYQHG
jgi:SnoaL-like protein